jgi:FkbM family methyltransferase
MLKLNIKINDLELKTELFELAVTDYNTEHKLYLCDKSHGMHRLFKSKFCDKSIDIEPITLELCHELDDIKIDFMKIDTEGTELDVIRGMYDLLEKNKPTMLIEFHPPTLLEYGVNPKEEYDFIKEQGYDIRLVPKIDESISYEDLYAATNNESGGQNILCEKK